MDKDQNKVITQLTAAVRLLQTQVRELSKFKDEFQKETVFKKQIRFKGKVYFENNVYFDDNVYDQNGAIVAEINP